MTDIEKLQKRIAELELEVQASKKRINEIDLQLYYLKQNVE
jgi:hypothetical protein